MRLPFLLVPVALLAAGCAAPVALDPTAPDADGNETEDPAPATPLPLGAEGTRLLCLEDGRCNFEMTRDEGRQGNEVTIAVNPRDPRNVVGGAKDYHPDDAGQCAWVGVYSTHDGGRTFDDRNLAGSPWRQLKEPDPSKRNYASQFWCTTDPVVTFDQKGRLYYVLMAYQADPVTASKTCADECRMPPEACRLGWCPHGAVNDWAINRAAQVVAVSDDGGRSFHTVAPIADGAFPVALHDKAWIAAQNDGSAVHALWISYFAPGQLYFRSVDGGRTWTHAKQLATLATGAGQGSFLDVGPGSEVYASWRNGDRVMLARSLDKGETWDEPRAVLETTPSRIGEGLSHRDRRDPGYPALAVDKFADSPFAGAVYFAWQDGRSSEDDPADVYFAASHDGGETFGEPVRLNDDATLRAQFMPALSVSPGGVIDVTWMDQRLDEEGLRIDQYYTYSLDGGRAWAPNFRVRDAPDKGWDPRLSKHQNGMVFLGDYLDVDSSWQAAHPIWPDTRGGEGVDVYTATVLRPMFAVGYPEEKKADALRFVADRPL